MVFHTHVYHARKLNPNLDKLTVIGSILPDFALTSAISWDDLHKKSGIVKFSSFVQETNPEQRSLLTGIQYHNSLDFLSHIAYQGTHGYAYNSITEELVSLVSKAFALDEQRARVTSHNFIESAVEYYVLQEQRELSFIVERTIAAMDMPPLTAMLATYYKKPEKEIATHFINFFSLITKYDLAKSDSWVPFWNDLSQFLFQRESNKNFIKKAFQLSLSLTKDTYKDFLTTAVSITDTEIVDSN